MSASRKFGTNPVKFCEDNVVIVCHGGPPGRFHFTLSPAKLTIARNWLGQPVPVYEVTKRDVAGPDTFEAYWLPYNNDAKYQIEMRDEADIMLTPTMDGCTFAVGGRSAQNAIKVAHLNYQKSISAGDPLHPTATINVIDQDKIDQEMAAIFEGGTTYVLRKGNYKSKEGHKITTYGWLTSKGWSFYYQKRKLIGMKTKTFDETQVLEGVNYTVPVKKQVEQYRFIGNYTAIKRV